MPKKKEKKEKKDWPENNDNFFFIKDTGFIGTEPFQTRSVEHQRLKSVGNIYETKQEADKAQERVLGAFRPRK